MIRETLTWNAVEVMQDYLTGQDILARPRHAPVSEWEICVNPIWNWEKYDYRTKYVSKWRKRVNLFKRLFR